MSLRDLKNLAPWQWESKVAQKKHAIGPKGIADFEQVARVLQLRPSCADAAYKDKQTHSTKRRRATKENEDPATLTNANGALADAGLAAATPAIPLKQQRQAIVTPADGAFRNKQLPSTLAASEQADAVLQGTTLATVEKGLRKPDPPPQVSVAELAGTPELTPIATPAPAAGQFSKTAAPAATTAAPVVKQNSKDMRYSSSSPKDASSQQELAKTALSPAACFRTPAAQTFHTQCNRTSGTVAAATTIVPGSAAGRTPAGLNPKNLLAEVFSPSPLPTPMPCAKLGFKTPCSAAKPQQLGLAKVGGSTAAAGGGGGSGGSSRVASITSTPLPRPQFTPKMPPPGSRRTSYSGAGLSIQQQQQQISSRPAAAARPAVSSSGKVLQSPAEPAQAHLDGMGRPVVGDDTMDNSTPGLLPGQAGGSPQALGAVQPAGRGSSSSTPPASALQLVTADSTATAGVVAEGQEEAADGGNRQISPAAAAAVSSSACLPAKLRCKKLGFSSSPETDGYMCTPAEIAIQPQQHDGAAAAARQAAAATAGYTTPVGRVGLKRRWCQNHAAAMAAEAVAAEGQLGSSGARSPDSLAVARSADLLLAAAAEEDMEYDNDRADLAVPDNMDQEEGCAEESEEAQPANAAVYAALSAMQVDVNSAEGQEARQSSEQPQEPAAVAAQQLGDRKYLCDQQQQEGTCNSMEMVEAAETAVAANAAPGASCGTSLLLPPAAQARLQMLQLQQPVVKLQQQQQLQAGSAAAAGRPVQYGVPYMYCLDASALSGRVNHEQYQQLSQLQQQQLAAAATGRIPHATAAQTAMKRTMHSAMAAHPAAAVQAHTPGRVAHDGTPAAVAAAAAATATHLGVLNGRLLLLQAHQQQLQKQCRSTSPAATDAAVNPAATAATTKAVNTAKPGSGALAHAAGAAANGVISSSSVQQAAGSSGLPCPAAHKKAAIAVTPAVALAAATNGGQQLASNGSSSRRVGSAQALDVTPLSVPGTLSDAEAWQLAQSQPWVIELEAARARQLLAHAVAAPAGSGGAGGC